MGKERNTIHNANFSPLVVLLWQVFIYKSRNIHNYSTAFTKSELLIPRRRSLPPKQSHLQSGIASPPTERAARNDTIDK